MSKQVPSNVIQATLYQYLADQQLTQENLTLAYSGGMDSHVLLHAFVALQQTRCPQLTLQAIYVDHGLQAASADWGRHCEAVCQTLGVSCDVLKVNIDCNTGESIEALARQARYDAIIDAMGKRSHLFTAHHQRDQAETLCLQLCRGAGVKGAAAMAQTSRLTDKYLHRPLLSIAYDDLLQYAKQHQLAWLSDPSNTARQFDRNFIRHDVLPLISARWPGVINNLNRAASHFADCQNLLDDLAQLDLANELEFNAWSMPYLSLPTLKSLRLTRRHNVMRYWFAKHGVRLPSQQQMNTIETTLIQARTDSRGSLQWGEHQCRRHSDRLYLVKTKPLRQHQLSDRYVWSADSHFVGLPWLFPLSAERRTALSCQPSDQVEIQFRQGGEWVQLQTATHRASLKKLFQQWQVPPWLRSQMPLVFINQRLAAILLPNTTVILQ